MVAVCLSEPLTRRIAVCEPEFSEIRVAVVLGKSDCVVVSDQRF